MIGDGVPASLKLERPIRPSTSRYFIRCYGKAGGWWTLEHFQAARPALESLLIMPGKWWPSGTTTFPIPSLFSQARPKCEHSCGKTARFRTLARWVDLMLFLPGCDNQRAGVIVGGSYVSFTPNPASGIPTLDPFLWDNGTMTDLGNLGGTFNFAQCINNRGQIIGMSSSPGILLPMRSAGKTAGCKI